MGLRGFQSPLHQCHLRGDQRVRRRWYGQRDAGRAGWILDGGKECTEPPCAADETESWVGTWSSMPGSLRMAQPPVLHSETGCYRLKQPRRAPASADASFGPSQTTGKPLKNGPNALQDPSGGHRDGLGMTVAKRQGVVRGSGRHPQMRRRRISARQMLSAPPKTPLGQQRPAATSSKHSTKW